MASSIEGARSCIVIHKIFLIGTIFQYSLHKLDPRVALVDKDYQAKFVDKILTIYTMTKYFNILSDIPARTHKTFHSDFFSHQI